MNSFWPVVRDSFDILHSLMPRIVCLSESPVRSVKDLVYKTLITVKELGTQPRPQFGTSTLLGIDHYTLTGRSRLSCSRHLLCCLGQYVCCNIVLGPEGPYVQCCLLLFLFFFFPLISFGLYPLAHTARHLTTRLVSSAGS